MSRARDVQWFEGNRRQLASQYRGRWLGVYQGEFQAAVGSEEEAVQFAVEKFGIDAASVFQAAEEDPFVYIGGGFR